MGLSDFFKKGKEEPAKTPSKGMHTPPGAQPSNAGSPFGTGMSRATGADQDIYTVQSGDSLSKIAKKHYGDATDWRKIYNANKDQIGDNPDLIHPGQRFVIPRD